MLEALTGRDKVHISKPISVVYPISFEIQIKDSLFPDSPCLCWGQCRLRWPS